MRKILKLTTATDFSNYDVIVSITWSDKSRETRRIPMPEFSKIREHQNLAEYLEEIENDIHAAAANSASPSGSGEKQ